MLLGARQVGKTYLLDKFCTNNFGKYHYFNFEETSELEQIFNYSINPHEIVENINLTLDHSISEGDCIFFDEIQLYPINYSDQLTSLNIQ